MVARPSSELYTPLQISMDDGPQSGSEGSELHSPGFGAYPPNDSFRYHHQDHQLIPQHTQFDYLPPVVGQQPPLIDAALEIPSPTSDEYGSGPFASSSRSNSHLTSSYIPSPISPRQSGIDYRYHSQSSERRLPSHDSNYHRPMPSVSINEDSRRVSGPLPASESPATSPTTTTSSNAARREVSSVVIACRQCRGRKIRCDSTRPVCNNCVRRSNVCEYDAVPKRRGPDKRPGTRQRSCKKRPTDDSGADTVPPPKRKRTEKKDIRQKIESDDDKIEALRRNSSYPNSHTSAYNHPQPSHPYSKMGGMNTFSSDHPKFPRPASLNTEQRTWWDDFLRSYTLRDIGEELHYLFKSAPQHLSFINIEKFLERLSNDPTSVQPSFVLAGMAMSTLMRSGGNMPAPGKSISDQVERAMYLRTLAEHALDAAYESHWVDATLAEAALILTLFETSLHPEHDPRRIEQALLRLDNIIRLLTLTTLDEGDRDVTRFSSRSVPCVPPPMSNSSHPPIIGPQSSCVCTPPDPARLPDPSKTYVYPLPWDTNWTLNEMRDEECRRLCWSALGLAAQYSIQCAVEERDTSMPRLFICDPGNYALLFPGEAVDRVSPPYRAADAPSPKDSVWALYCRSLLLWCFCDGIRRTSLFGTRDGEDLAEYAQESWNEAQAIQDALEAHQCNLDTTVMWMCKEYIYNCRMAITQALRRSVLVPESVAPGPAFTPKQAEEWVYFQQEIVKRATFSIQQSGAANQLARRPYQATWFATQLALCLRLWNHDRTLYSALELGRAITYPLDFINTLWPCATHQHYCAELQKRLQAAYASTTSDGHFRRSL
ncbi:hypothetical protein CPB85DRAFT_1276709 [Mucidula mucida]|nr:hypothetical protein CPB85DRAFT_1276709 [Mucidula mucida]